MSDFPEPHETDESHGDPQAWAAPSEHTNDSSDQEPLADEVGDAGEAAGQRKPSPAADRKRLRAAAHRAAVSKAFEVIEERTPTKSLLGAVIGSPYNINDSGLPADRRLTLAILAAEPADIEPLHALLALRSVDPFDLAIELTSMGRLKMKSIWATIEHLTGAPASEALHKSEPKAARQVAVALREVTDDDWRTVQDAIALFSKSG
jgi:hypothetical protein